MLLSIVTLNYKKSDLTLLCISSLIEQFSDKLEKNQMEIIIVDNDSQDDSVEKLQAFVKKNKDKNISVIANSENGGFGKGNNIGAKQAKGDYILFLNNDTQVKDEGLWEMAVYMTEHPTVAILGGQLTNPDGSKQASRGSFYNLLTIFFLLLGFQKFGLLDSSPKKVTRVDWVKGGLLMIRREVFEKLGGFDERIFMYTEDMELCYRGKQQGFHVLFYPNINVVHAEHGSANRSFAIIHIYKGLLYFYKKHKNYFEYLIVKALLVMKAWIAIGLGKVLDKPSLVHTYKEAIKFNL